MSIAEVPSSKSSPTPKARPVPGTHLPSFVFETGYGLARHAAQMIARLVRERTDLGQKTVLGLLRDRHRSAPIAN